MMLGCWSGITSGQAVTEISVCLLCVTLQHTLCCRFAHLTPLTEYCVCFEFYANLLRTASLICACQLFPIMPPERANHDNNNNKGMMWHRKACWQTVTWAKCRSNFPLSYTEEIVMIPSINRLHHRPADCVYISSLRFITADNNNAHHCILYDKVSWSSLIERHNNHCVCLLLRNKLLSWLLSRADLWETLLHC